MSQSSFQRILELQTSMASFTEGQVASAALASSPEVALKQLSEDIQSSKAALDGATKERDLILKYWAERITILQERLEQQQRALEEIQRSTDAPKKKSRGSTVKKPT